MPRFNNYGARRQNNGGQSSSRRNAGETSGARSATTTTFSDSRGDDSAHLETVQAFHKEGQTNKLSDISESCSLGEIMTWCRWFERRLEVLGTPGSIILLLRMFAEATPSRFESESRALGRRRAFYRTCVYSSEEARLCVASPLSLS